MREFSLLSFVLLFSLLSHVYADDLSFSTPSVAVDGSGGWSWTTHASMNGSELGTMIETEIGSGNYMSVTVMLMTCYSGAGTDNVAAALSGDHIVIAATGANATSETVEKRGGGLYGFGAGFFDSLSQNSGRTVAQHFAQAQGNILPIRNPGTPDSIMKAQFDRYRERVIQTNVRRQQSGQEPLEVPPEWGSGGRETWVQQPEHNASNPGMLQMPLGGEAQSNHAIIYRAYEGELGATEANNTKNALSGMGYDSVDEMTPWTDSDSAEMQAASDESRLPNVRSDLATPQNLRSKLKALRDPPDPQMNNMEHLLVIVMAHGSRVEQSARSSNGGAPRSALLRNGHELFNSVNNLDTLGSRNSANLLAEEVLDPGKIIIDSPTLKHWRQPILTIQTLSESNPSGEDVEVFVNDVKLGNMNLDSNNTGFHQFEFSNEIIRNIVQNTDFSSGLSLRFKFVSALDNFVLAERADIEAQNGAHGYSGISLNYGLDGDHPENLSFLPAMYYLLLH